MKNFFLVPPALLASLFVVTAIQSQQPGVYAPQVSNVGTDSPSAAANDTMIVSSSRLASGNTQVVAVDTRRTSMAVYEIAADSGQIQLKSVRSMSADFILDEFNGTDPSPSKVRSILPR